MIKALFCECSAPFWVQVAQRLCAEHGWEAVHWTSSQKVEPLVRASFPRAVFHDKLEAIRGLLPPYPARPPPSPSAGLLRDLAYEQAIVLKMMDRMDPLGVFGHEERVRLYLRLVGNALALLEHHQPQAMVLPTSPHQMYDYLLYALCRRAGVRTFMFERTAFPGLIYLVENFEESPQDVLERYRELTSAGRPAVISEQSRGVVERVLKSYDQGMPFYLRQKLDKRGRREAPGLAPRLKDLAYLARRPKDLWAKLRAGYDFLAAPAPANYLKQPGRAIEDSAMGGLEWRLHRKRGDRKKRRLLKTYHGLCRTPDLARPFVYVGLHHQPERTTCPNGGFFVYQQLMVQMLSCSLPEGWMLYVKEHVSQNQPYSRGEQGREAFHYADLAALPKVVLAPLGTDPFTLMDRSRAVATVTGATGWEALLRGKPALVFGPAWYRGCKGTFSIASPEQAREALAAIAAGYRVEREDVLRFIEAFEELGIRGWTDQRWEKVSGLTQEQNVAALSRALGRACAGRHPQADMGKANG